MNHKTLMACGVITVMITTVIVVLWKSTGGQTTVDQDTALIAEQPLKPVAPSEESVDYSDNNASALGSMTIDDINNIQVTTSYDFTEIMDMEWDSWPIAALFQDRSMLSQAVAEIPVLSDAGIDDVAVEQLRSDLEEIMFLWGHNDTKGYLEWLLARGQYLDPALSEYYLNKVEEDSNQLFDDGLSALYYTIESNPDQYEAMWKGLVLQGSSIKIRRIISPDQNPPLGSHLHNMRQAITNWRLFTLPPTSIEQAIVDHGSIPIADVRVFIAHESDLEGKTRPYIMRLWYDESASLWRPLAMSAFQNRFEDFPVSIIY